ncbi:MAG: carboxypeptidase-like regulatory domain-containing protein [Prevotellaceae bacterium]|jgi:uncharacterized protein YfaS (alpha-2-macroglobulin family)|nr:carboxypeptidase-like regulatory domain-containing protein [Prevotellaceae bacterium]
MKRLFTILATVFIFVYCAKAQTNNEKWIEIDTLFADGLYKTALEKLNVIYDQSLKSKDDVQFVKAIIYRMACQQYTEENVSASKINTLRNDLQNVKSDVARALINSLLGETFLNYYQQNRWQYHNRTDVNDDKSNLDIATWSLNRIFEECINAYKRSLENSDALEQIKIDYLNDILTGNRELREYRPTLFDFVAHRAVAVFGNSEIRLTKPKDVFLPDDENLFTFDAEQFAKMQISSNDSTSNLLFALNILQQLTKFHLKQNDALAIGDITLKRFDFLINNSTLQNKKSLIMLNLQKIIENTEKNRIWFEANCKLSMMYKENAEEAKAVEICEMALQQKNISEKYKTAIEKLIAQIKLPALELTVENVNLPLKPIKILVKYKDIDTVYFRIYQIPNEYRMFALKNIEKLNTDKEKFIERNALLIREFGTSLEQTNDYKIHTTEVVYPKPLARGLYIILASNSPDFFNANEKIIECATFQLSSVAYVYRNMNPTTNEIYLANRMTGEPLQNARFRVSDNNMATKKECTSNEHGIIRDNISVGYNDIITVANKRNTLLVKNSNILLNRYASFNFQDRKITKFFLDRAIYRPGQTVYFKGISLDYNDNKHTIAVNRKETIILKDVNRQEVAKMDVVSNEYGTFSGSFVLPQSTVGGTFEIANLSNRGTVYFNVEEYKRPTFEATINPVEKNYKFNEIVNVSGTAKSYAGYNIDKAKVSYNVTRIIEFPYRWWHPIFYNSTNIIANGETTTDENGKFNINFFADENGLENDMQIAVYNISADITDNNGETHSATYALRISKKPIVIQTNIPETANTEDELLFDLFTQNLNDNQTKSDITVNIYKLKQPDKPLRERLWEKPDKPNLSYAEYKKYFPNDVYEDEDKIENFEEIALIKTISFNTDKTKTINLNELKKYGSASYRLDITAKISENITTNTKVYIQLQSNNVLTDMKNWVRKGKQTENEVEFFVGGMSDSVYVHYDVIYRNNLIEAKNIIVGKTPQSVKIAIPETKNNEEFAVSFVSIFDNRVYTFQSVLKPSEDKKTLDISLVTFRDKLQPGAKEQWKLRIKSPTEEKTMAEMLASLYDASLDAFVAHDWDMNFAKSYSLNYYNSQWNKSNIFSFSNSKTLYGIFVNNNIYLPNKNYDIFINANYIKKYAKYIKATKQITKTEGKIKGIVSDENYEPLSYVSIRLKYKPAIETLTDKYGKFEISAKKGDILVFSFIGYEAQEIAADNDIMNVVFHPDSNMLSENIVAAYSVTKKEALLGSVSEMESSVMQRSSNESYDEFTDEVIPFAVVFGRDGKPLNDYARRLTKNVELRTNFNETAFFYPELRTDKNGEIIIDFVIPESLTKWKLLGLAHTKNLETGKITAYTVTQKEVAISANAPRFFRNGDNIEFSAKINNITENKIKGKVRLLLFDAFTMQPLNIIAAETEQDFSVNSNQSVAVNWRLKIPSNIEAITSRVIAVTDKHSDGEEKTIPVLPNSMLVTESLPFTARPNQSKDFIFEKLINNTSSTLKNYSYTLEFTSNPIWYAVQAMPYMMEYPHECSEQLFSRFYANSLSATVINKFPQIKRTFDLWKMKDSKELISNLEKNQELKNILIEETPWLRTAKDESENKKRIALLFDLNKMQNEQKSALSKLKNSQMANGAFPWFGGMCESRYITQHIAIGLLHLKKLGAINKIYQDDVEKIINSAIKYLDRQMLDDYNRMQKNVTDLNKYEISEIIVHYLYMRSFVGISDLQTKEKTAFEYFFNRMDEKIFDKEIYRQTLTALAAHRLGKPESAQKIINSLKQRAQHSERIGMYWTENRKGYFWYQSPVETQSLLIEAFTEIGDNQNEIEEMKIWLLQNKQTNHWGTTKSTAEACYALLMNNDNIAANSELLQVKINGKPLETMQNNDLQQSEMATGYVKTSWHNDEIQNNFGKINVTNPNKTIAWGAAYWQYFENLDKITSSETGLKIKREYFIEKNTDSGAKLNRITENSKINTGDKIKVRIEVNADRDYEYLHLKDMRASGCEPVNVISRAKYQDGLWYYENTKDASTNFFIYQMKKGTYVFEYELRANNAGDFSTGIATIQCMYAPEFSAHSAGEKITVETTDF